MNMIEIVRSTFMCTFSLILLILTITQGQGSDVFEISSISSSTDESHEDAFEHSHEEGDEHVVNREVCSSQDLPDETIAAYDRCTNFIPVYKVCQTLPFNLSLSISPFQSLPFNLSVPLSSSNFLLLQFFRLHFGSTVLVSDNLFFRNSIS